MARKKLQYITKTKFFDSIRKGEWKAFINSTLDAEFKIKNIRIHGYTILSFAAEYGDLGIIEYLVQKGADVNATNRDGTKPLHIASKHNHKDLVEFFINLGVFVDSRDNFNRTPLHYAAEKFHRQVAKPHVWKPHIVRKHNELNFMYGQRFSNHTYRHTVDTLPAIICPDSKIHMELANVLLVNGADFDASDSKGDVPLLLAAKYLCVDVVKMLILSGANVVCCDENKWTVLHYASFAGWLDVVESYVDRGIDVNGKTSSGKSALTFAVNNSHEEVVELLIKSGANDESVGTFEMPVLHRASKKGWLNVVQSFVDRGSDVNAKSFSGSTPLILSIQYSQRAVFDLLVKSGANLDCSDNSKTTLLHYACQTGWLDVAQSLMESGCDINAENSAGNTPLFFAAEYSHKEIFDVLFKSGAHFHVCKLKMWTFLHYACRAGWLDVVLSLLNAGYDINVKTLDGVTPLFVAAKLSHIDIFECLIENGADVNCKIPRKSYYDRVCDGSGSYTDSDDGEEWIILHHASYNGWLAVVKSLIKKGVDVNVKTFEGDTPLHLAARGNNSEIVKHLLKAGARCNIINEDGKTAFKHFIQYNHASADIIRLFIENGVYILHNNFDTLSMHAFFKEDILQDVKLCTQAIINEFNNLDLEEVYSVPLAVECLPDIEKMKIKSNRSVVHSIEQSVRHEIETKGYCDITEVRPIVLSLLSVRSFIDHYI